MAHEVKEVKVVGDVARSCGMDEVNELKPCPFCGGEAVIKTDPDIPGLDGYQIGCESKPTQYVCPGCISTSAYYWNKEMAIISWNRRA